MLFPFQQQNAARLAEILSAHPFALDASDTGTGKSFTALAAAARMGRKPFIIAPAATLLGWDRTLAATETKPAGRVSLESFRLRPTPIPDDALPIIDEIHRAGNVGTKGAKAILRLPRPILGLSATAAMSPLSLFTVGALLGLHDAKFWGWVGFLRACGCYQDTFNAWHVPADTSKATNFIGPALAARSVRARLSDAFPDMPGRMDAVEVAKLAVSEHLPPDNADHIKLRQYIELRKLPWMVKRAIELAEEGKSVSIFVNFRESIARLHRDLSCPVVQGEQSPSDRAASLDAFQSGKAPIIALNIQAGGTGINLHHESGGGPRVSLLSPTWNAVDLIQASGRIHRAGSKSSALNILVLSDHKMEKKIAKSLGRKFDFLRSLTDINLQSPFLPK